MPTAIATVGAAVIGSRASSRAADKASKGVERGQDILAASRDRARQDVMRIFPQALEAQNRGFQQAQDFLAGQVLPQQAQAFQTGNVQAQETLLAGLPQIQQAILGGQVDTSGLQARTTPFQQFTGEFTPFMERPDPTTTPAVDPNILAGIDYALGGGLGGLGGYLSGKNIGLPDFTRSFR